MFRGEENFCKTYILCTFRTIAFLKWLFGTYKTAETRKFAYKTDFFYKLYNVKQLINPERFNNAFCLLLQQLFNLQFKDKFA